MTGPQTDPRPGDTAHNPRAGEHARVLARRGDVVDLEVGYRDPARVTPHAPSRAATRVLRDTGHRVEEGVAVTAWATSYPQYARRDPTTTDPRAGDVLVRPTHGGYVVKVVVEGVDTAAVWIRNHDNGNRGQTRVRREDWDAWVADNGLYGVTD